MARKKTAVKKPKSKSKPQKPRAKVVTLSPKTGKVIKARKGQLVFYGYKDGRKIRRIETDFSQKYSSKDRDVIAAEIDKSATKNVVLYEERTGKRVKEKYQQVKKGKSILNIPVKKAVIQYQTYYDKIQKATKFVRDKKNRKVPVFEPKIVAPKAGRKQRAVLFTDGRRKKTLTPFERISQANIIRNEKLIVLPLGSTRTKYTRKIILNERTIKATIKNIARKDKMKRGTRGVVVETRLFLPDRGPLNITVGIRPAENFTTKVSKAIRDRMIMLGLRFTSVYDLESIEREAEEAGEEEIDLTRLGYNRHIRELSPIFPETGIKRTYSPGDRRNPKVYVQFRLIPWERS